MGTRFDYLRFLIEKKDFGEAEREIQKELQMDDESESLWLLLIDLYRDKGEVHMEIKTWKAIIERFPLWFQPWQELEKLYRQLHQINDAEQARRESVRLLKKQWL